VRRRKSGTNNEAATIVTSQKESIASDLSAGDFRLKISRIVAGMLTVSYSVGSARRGLYLIEVIIIGC
jgi:hypothetical protein